MSTKTMQPSSRRVSWASPIATSKGSGSTKRNERENALERPKKLPTTTTPMKKLLKLDKPRNKEGSKLMNYSKTSSNLKPTSYTDKGSNTKPMIYDNKDSSSKGKNQLLAGYLAHEYLTKGTILGKRWDHLPSQRVEPKQEDKHRMYMELAQLLKTNETHMDGIVNPTQLAHSLRLL